MDKRKRFKKIVEGISTVKIQGATNIAKKALEAYIKIYQEFLAIDGFWGVKSDLEKFPGAEQTYTFEALMPDGKALQGATSHDLGQNFSKSFGISAFLINFLIFAPF